MRSLTEYDARFKITLTEKFQGQLEGTTWTFWYLSAAADLIFTSKSKRNFKNDPVGDSWYWSAGVNVLAAISGHHVQHQSARTKLISYFAAQLLFVIKVVCFCY